MSKRTQHKPEIMWAVIINPGPRRIHVYGGTEEEARQVAHLYILEHGKRAPEEYTVSVRGPFRRKESPHVD